MATESATPDSSDDAPGTTTDVVSTTQSASVTSAVDPTSSSGTSSNGTSSNGTSSDGTSSDDSSESSGGNNTCTPLIVESLTSLTGADNSREWVVLHNPCMDAYDLTPYTLAYGSELGIEDALALVGMMMPGDCFIIGGPTSDASNFDPMYDQLHEFSPTLDAGEGAILLYELPPAAVDITDVPIDAVIYGNNNLPGYLDTNGIVAAPMIGDPANDQSMRRTSLGPTWEFGDPPTPNACPMF